MKTIRLLAAALCGLMVVVTGCGTTSSVSVGLPELNSKRHAVAGLAPQEVQRISNTLVTSYKAERVRDWNSHQPPPGEELSMPWGGGSIFGSKTDSMEVAPDEKLAKSESNSSIDDTKASIKSEQKIDAKVPGTATRSNESPLPKPEHTGIAPTELPPNQSSLTLMKKVHAGLRDAAQRSNRSHVEELYVDLGTRLRLAELGVEEDLADLQLNLGLLENYLKEAK